MCPWCTAPNALSLPVRGDRRFWGGVLSGRYRTARGRVWRCGPLPVYSVVARASSRFFSDRCGRPLPAHFFLSPAFAGSGVQLPLSGLNRSASPCGIGHHLRRCSETQRFGAYGRKKRPGPSGYNKSSPVEKTMGKLHRYSRRPRGNPLTGQKYPVNKAIRGKSSDGRLAPQSGGAPVTDSPSAEDRIWPSSRSTSGAAGTALP